MQVNNNIIPFTKNIAPGFENKFKIGISANELGDLGIAQFDSKTLAEFGVVVVEANNTSSLDRNVYSKKYQEYSGKIKDTQEELSPLLNRIHQCDLISQKVPESYTKTKQKLETLLKNYQQLQINMFEFFQEETNEQLDTTRGELTEQKQTNVDRQRDIEGISAALAEQKQVNAKRQRDIEGFENVFNKFIDTASSDQYKDYTIVLLGTLKGTLENMIEKSPPSAGESDDSLEILDNMQKIIAQRLKAAL